MQDKSCGSPLVSLKSGFCAGQAGGNRRAGCPHSDWPIQASWPRGSRGPLLPVGAWESPRRRSGPGRVARPRSGAGGRSPRPPASRRGASLPPQPATRPSRHPPLPWKPAAAPGGGGRAVGAGRQAAPQGPEGTGLGDGARRFEGGSPRGCACGARVLALGGGRGPGTAGSALWGTLWGGCLAPRRAPWVGAWHCRGARGAEGLSGAPWAAQGLSPGPAGRAGPAAQGRRVSGGRCARGYAGRAAGLR